MQMNEIDKIRLSGKIADVFRAVGMAGPDTSATPAEPPSVHHKEIRKTFNGRAVDGDIGRGIDFLRHSENAFNDGVPENDLEVLRALIERAFGRFPKEQKDAYAANLVKKFGSRSR